MGTTIGIGTSSSPDSRIAAREATAAALRDCDSPAFALVFATVDYVADELAGALSHELGTVPWAGCCTAGVFAGSKLLQQGVVVGVFSSQSLRPGVGVGGPISVDPRSAGRAAVAEAFASLPPVPESGQRAVIVLPDALTGNAVEVIRGAAEEAGTGVVWAGGGAGDSLRSHKTAQFARGQAFRDRVVVIAMDAGPFATGIRHGLRPYGPPTMVTRAEGPVAFELEYEPAFEVYRRTAASRGDDVTRESFARFATSHPLGIPQASGEFVIRDPLEVLADGSLRCIAEVPDGSLVRVMEGNPDALISAGYEAALTARKSLPGPVGGAVVFDCVSRYIALGERIREELAGIGEGIGGGVPLMGCLTFGEVGAAESGMPQFHNKTAVVLAMTR